MTEKKTVLVTGGTGGIGTAINERLTAEGYQVVAADLNVDPAQNGTLSKTGTAEVYLHQIEVQDTESVAACVRKAVEIGCGKLAGVVNCHGVVRHTPIETVTDAEMEMVWNVNVAGSARVCQAAVAHLEPNSAIVNISSVTAWLGRLPGASMYGASKSALQAYTRYLACELADQSIRVNAIAPGFILALPLSESMKAIGWGGTEEQVIARLKAEIPMNRFGKCEEIADSVEFLLSPRASYITGTTLLVDGGVAAR